MYRSSNENKHHETSSLFLKPGETDTDLVSNNFRQASEISSLSACSQISTLPKMTNFEAYIAIIKGYCAINILIIPK